MMAKTFDAIIIGAGQAGPSLAGRLTAAGMSVALIERKLFGGTCVNTGCTPTKTLVASAYAAHLARRAADYGVTLVAGRRRRHQAVKARKDTVAHNSRTGLEKWIAGMDKMHALSRPCAVRIRQHGARRRRPADSAANLPQHRRARRGARPARHPRHRLF